MVSHQRAELSTLVSRGETSHGSYLVDIDAESAGWEFCGLRVVTLAPGEILRFGTGESETIVLPLAGACTVSCDSMDFELRGRKSVFTGVSDFVYLPRDAEVELTSLEGGRFALPSAKTKTRLVARYGAAESVPVELRGAGAASRQVNNFCSPESFDAAALIAVEVLTPGGNWSSYPPHKHDEATDTESQLEEIYYFEVLNDGPAYQRVYSTNGNRPIDLTAEVTSGDVVLIPFGFHGPSMAAPGYDLYYLNVMAGPNERVWRFCDDPKHSWIRGIWNNMEVDPRLPLTAAENI